MQSKVIGIATLSLAISCMSSDTGSDMSSDDQPELVSSETGRESTAPAAGLDPDTEAGIESAPGIESTADIDAMSKEPDWTVDACFWSPWQCGAIGCPNGFYAHGVDFNAVQSENCWGAGTDFDEPYRRLQCCDAPFARQQGCYWTPLGCGAVQCRSGYFLAGVNFTSLPSEGCWGAGNDYDEPRRQIRCCEGDLAAPNNCYWTGWGCGAFQCAPGYYLAGVDFNATQSEGCWGAGNNYDEPRRRLYCCQ